MAEYIEREALLKKQQMDADIFKGSTLRTDMARRDEALNAVANIVNAPSADVAPVRHGRWIHKKDKRWMGGGKTVCSVCESGLSDGGYIAVRTFSYCPECGAKMDGGKNV